MFERSMMLLPTLICWVSLAASQSFDSIEGRNLLGSHFGAPFFNASFDYVVVGGGTAGLTIATRLAQNSSFSVAVIEAGGFSETDNANFSAVPAFNGYWVGKKPEIRNPLIDWEIVTEPMTGFGGESMSYAAGKSLGGSSTRNSMTFHRPTIGSLKAWADAVGDQSYSWDAMQQYFLRSASFHPPPNDLRPQNASVSVGRGAFDTLGGPLRISFPNWSNAYSSWAKLALKELGLEEQEDLLSGKLAGYQYTATTMDGEAQTRSSSETSFLRTALKFTTNMNIYKSTLAKKIIFDDRKRAMGVLVETAGVRYTISARKEVIVSAGVFRSPQLLMVSGIGPAERLQDLSIQVVADRPGVGQDMWDHVLLGPSYPVNVVTHSALQDPSFTASQVASYVANRTGILTNTASELLGWEKAPSSVRKNLSNETLSGLAWYPEDWPDFEYIFPDAFGGLLNDFTVGAPLDGVNYGTISVGLSTPLSRGNITIKSTDTADNPIVNPNLLGDPRDLEIAVQAFRRAREIANTTALRIIITGPEAFPGPDVQSDDDLIEMIKQSANTIYHASCTCKMGKSGDANAVVDSQARVFGVEALRVVDASAFPLLPPGHPTSVVYALAEKIADAILLSSEGT